MNVSQDGHGPAKLKLTGITFRGIGPYVGGARIDIRPITVICGRNGSGKSAWVNALRDVIASAKDKNFPFQVRYHDLFFERPLVTNVQYVRMEEGAFPDPRKDYDNRARFGPIGTIGLEMIATDNLELGSAKRFRSHAAKDPDPVTKLLLLGSCLKGTRLRIRLTHPRVLSDSVKDVEYRVELGVGEQTASAYFRAMSSSLRMPEEELFRDLELPLAAERNFAGIDRPTIVKFLGRRIRQIVGLLAESSFFIGAIRVSDPREDLYKKNRNREKGYKKAIPSDRSVGIDGANTWDCFWQLRKKGQSPSSEKIPDNPYADKVGKALKQLLGVTLDANLDADGPLFSSEYNHVPTIAASMSAGFHQIAPMVVQIAAMRRGEFLSIENPEVHLHPDLVLKLTEYLLSEAIDSSKTFFIETHSDLIVRRLVRAILEEYKGEGQRSVNIVFTKSEPVLDGENSASAFPMKIDKERGLPAWPEGFLSESIRESELLLELLGRPAEEYMDE